MNSITFARDPTAAVVRYTDAMATGRAGLRLRLQTFSYRFAEQVLNSNLAIRREIEETLLDSSIEVTSLSRPVFNALLRDRFVARGWEHQPAVFDEPGDPSAKMDFLKSRVGIEVGFGHRSFIGIDLLKFQVASYSAMNKIDIGVYVVTTRACQTRLMAECGQKWEGSLSFEQVTRYLPHFKSAIQVPILVLGVDL
jgi:hypothetical protein